LNFLTDLFFNSDQERASDEKQVEKLFRDLTSGMLRRKRGADYDLSDSDDGGEARRRMKRRQFAKMQKALMADERISKVAENPRNQAFLRTIEDRGSDDDMDFLFEPPAAPTQDESQRSQSADVVPDSQPAVTGTVAAPRAPAPQRRTKNGRRATTLGEIRENLSTLLDDGRSGAIIPATLSSDDDSGGSDADEEDNSPRKRRRFASSDKENRSPSRRRRPAIVDRLSLKRESSSSSSTSGRMAFAAASSVSGGVQVPALLRRATTNSLISNGSSNSGGGFGEERAANGGGGGTGAAAGKLKKTAGKMSGIHSFARENERKMALAEKEKRRMERKWKGAEGRGRIVGGLFGKGQFE
jgi:mediator of replication checkpoint protein 1